MKTASESNSDLATSPQQSAYVLGVRVDGTSYKAATSLVMRWAERGESRYVCAADVHMIMRSYDNAAFRAAINGADLVTPDGMPLVWMLRRLGLRGQPRVCGPDLTLVLCAAAAQRQIAVGFLGGTSTAVNQLVSRLQNKFPTLNIVYSHSPPFRPMSAEENTDILLQVQRAGCRILFVGLGCPKQESWMAANKAFLPSVMIGIGAAFDFLSGEKRRAFPWMQRSGLEWAFCLAMEPRRLWFRHLYYNPRFVALAVLQLLRRKFTGQKSDTE